MTLPSNDELREFENALQLSISSKTTGVHRVRDGALEIGFARAALAHSTDKFASLSARTPSLDRSCD